MILVMPVMDGHEWTEQTVRALAATTSMPDLRLVVWDNGSQVPYRRRELPEAPFQIDVLVSENVGYYAPLFYALEHGTDDLVGLIHNDLLVHEVGWDRRLEHCFRDDPKLGLVGFVGSYEVDENGGRGAGTMCYFRERDSTGTVIGQPQSAGELIHDLRPSVVLDSLFMVFRREVVSLLGSDSDDLPLAHFYDKIWPLRLVDAGYRVGTLGVEVSHCGGITLVANGRYVAEDCKRWCWARGVREVPNDDWQLQMYREGERRLLSEFKRPGGLIPSRVERDWSVHRGG